MASTLYHTAPGEGATNDWLTPPALVKLLGPFDLDPCAHPNQVRGGVLNPLAKRCYAPPQDGLKMSWEGRVWLNPPYGPHAGAWARKLKDHGNGILLIFARTETNWFHESCWDGDGYFFIKGRLHFFLPNGVQSTGCGVGSVLIAYGKNNVAALQWLNLRGAMFDRWPILNLTGERADKLGR